MWDEPRIEPWASADWEADPGWEWHSAAHDSVDDLLDIWTSAVDRARAAAERAAADGGFLRVASRSWPDGNAPSLRWILTHLIEEYARHNGHADLIRESIDGLVGE